MGRPLDGFGMGETRREALSILSTADYLLAPKAHGTVPGKPEV